MGWQMDPLHAQPVWRGDAFAGLPALPAGEPVFSACDACGAVPTDLRPLHPVTGRCPDCEGYARDRWNAGRYASEARPGQVVDDAATAEFAYLLPRALAHRGLVAAREALRWVIRRAS